MEYSRVCLLASIIYVSFVCLLSAAAEEKGKGKCGNLDIKLTQDDMTNLHECIKEVGAESWQHLAQEHMACFGKCVIMKQNLVDETGTPHVENIMAAVNQSMPESVRGTLLLLMESCLNDHAPKVDPKETSCNSYTPLMNCIHASYTEACKSG